MDGKILIVDDIEGIRNSLGEYFQNRGFTTILADNGEQALERVRNAKPDLVILDVQLPKTDGLEVCKKIRQESGQAIGIIMISGVRRETVDRVVGLELGADAYITKPFETSELLAQARALLRRLRSQNQEAQTGWFVIDDHLRIHFDQRIVEVDGREVHLPKLEFDLLKFLVERSPAAVSRSDLIDKVWGFKLGENFDESINDGAINSAVAKLRAKIELGPTNPRYIHPVHGVGYRFKRN